MSSNSLATLCRVSAFVFFIALLGSSNLKADAIFYSNDFDGNVETGLGVGVSISGGITETDGQASGVVSGQSYSSVAGFGGNFWRVTTPDDVLQFELTDLPIGYFVNVEFSLAIIDSWDGASGAPHGPDHLEVEILDGATQEVLWNENVSGGATPANNVESTIVINQDLGFSQGTAGETWWLDDGYRMVFDGIEMNSSSLTFRIHATGSGFVGGTDESFAIDNLLITGVPEPSMTVPVLAIACLMVRRRKRSV